VNKKEAEKVVGELETDERQDLLMFLAEIFDFRVFDGDDEVTYFLSTDDGNQTV